MTTIFVNGKQLIQSHPNVSSTLCDVAQKVTGVDKGGFCFVQQKERDFLYAVGKDETLFLEGDASLASEIAKTLADYNLTFATLVAQSHLAQVFFEEYKKLFDGTATFDGVSWRWQGGSIKVLQLAGGCFWCSAKPYYEYDGVLRVASGYAGGRVVNPTYEQVKSGKTGHKETILITYDSKTIDFRTLLDVYFNTIDPYDGEGQFIDKGESYTLAIFSNEKEVLQYAQAVIDDAEKRSGKKCFISLLPSVVFYKAEEYHQDYSIKNQSAMQEELISSGRADKLFDFNFNVVENSEIQTTLRQKTLVLHKVYKYQGPVTMQLLPFGGIQTVFGGSLVINCKNGFFTCDTLTYDGKTQSTKDFVETNSNLVNLVLPN